MGKKKGQAAAGTSKDEDDDALLDAAIAENAKSKSMEAAAFAEMSPALAQGRMQK